MRVRHTTELLLCVSAIILASHTALQTVVVCQVSLPMARKGLKQKTRLIVS